MNITETGITINPLPTLIVAGAIACVLITVRAITKHRHRRKEYLVSVAHEKAKKKQEERQAIEKLFPSPWLEAYDTCMKTAVYAARQEWLKKWIGEQSKLPPLSIEAIENFCRRIEDIDNDHWREAMAIFAPYFDTGVPSVSTPLNESPVVEKRDWYPKEGEVNPEYCKQHLPPKWYDLAKQSKGVWNSSFGSQHRRQRFLDRIKEIEEKELNPSQILLLARIFGEGDVAGSDFYAAHLEEYTIQMGAAKPNILPDSPKTIWITRDKDDHFDHSLYTWRKNKPYWQGREYVTKGHLSGFSTDIPMDTIEENIGTTQTKKFFADLNISTEKGSCNKVSIITTMGASTPDGSRRAKTIWITRDRDFCSSRLYLWREKPTWYDDKNNMHYDMRDYDYKRRSQTISKIHINEEEGNSTNVCQILEDLNISTEKGSCNEITVETTFEKSYQMTRREC